MGDAELISHRIEMARQLFAAWSSGDPDAPEPYLAPDAVLFDVAGGRFEGWPAIRAFFAAGLEKWNDLVLAPDEFWSNDGGLALHYVMSATIRDPEQYGAAWVGRRWEVEVMSLLRFTDDRVSYEADFHDRGARRRYIEAN
jgi:ketosteroid isomerase-like protein